MRGSHNRRGVGEIRRCDFRKPLLDRHLGPFLLRSGKVLDPFVDQGAQGFEHFDPGVPEMLPRILGSEAEKRCQVQPLSLIHI